jgi:hypothetical protein
MILSWRNGHGAHWYGTIVHIKIIRGGLSKNNMTPDLLYYITFQNSIWYEQHIEGGL